MAKAKKSSVKKANSKKAAPAKKAAAKKSAVKRAVPVKKAVAKKSVAKKPVSKRTPAKKSEPAKLSAKTAKTSPALSAMVSPLDDRILVWVDEASETTTPSGLILVGSESQSEKVIGRVEAVGRGHMNKKGKIRPLDIQKGDYVMFPRYSGAKVTVEGTELVILRESEVLGIVER